MVAANYDAIMRRVLADEGGNDDDPRDPGGRTSRGITQREYNVYRQTHPGLPSDVWKAPQSAIMDIYRQNYWNPVRGDDLPSGVDYAVDDYAINSGVGRSSKVLQRLVGVPVDGVIGPVTLAAVAKRNSKDLVNAICDERLRFLQGLSTWQYFGKGWKRRVDGVRAAALAMAAHAPAPPQPTPMAVPAGKGTVADPTVKGTATKAGGAAATAGAAAGATYWDWVTSHPIESVLIAVGLAFAVAAIVMGVKQWYESTYESRQTTPPADLKPLPEAAA